MISKEKGDLSEFQISLVPFFGLANDGYSSQVSFNFDKFISLINGL